MPSELVSLPTEFITSALTLGVVVYIAWAGIMLIAVLAALKD